MLKLEKNFKVIFVSIFLLSVSFADEIDNMDSYMFREAALLCGVFVENYELARGRIKSNNAEKNCVLSKVSEVTIRDEEVKRKIKEKRDAEKRLMNADCSLISDLVLRDVCIKNKKI